MNRINLTSLEEAVLDTIEKVYQCKYVKPLKVIVESSTNGLSYYELQLYIHEPYRDPLIIATQCASDNEFIEFVIKDLKESELIRRKQYGLIFYGNNDA